MVRKKHRPVIKAKIKRSSDYSEENGGQKIKNDSTLNKKKRGQIMHVLVQHHPKVMPMTRKIYKEIRNLQISTGRLIPCLPFQRLVREIMQQFSTDETLRVQTEALRALQDAAEMYMTQFLEDAYFCTLHAKRKTLFVSDMQCVRRLRGRTDIINH